MVFIPSITLVLGSMSANTNPISVSLQLLLWKAFWFGNITEHDAVVSEYGRTNWDMNSDDLERNELVIDGERVPVPYRWALPGVTELLLLKDNL